MFSSTITTATARCCLSRLAACVSVDNALRTHVDRAAQRQGHETDRQRETDVERQVHRHPLCLLPSLAVDAFLFLLLLLHVLLPSFFGYVLLSPIYRMPMNERVEKHNPEEKERFPCFSFSFVISGALDEFLPFPISFTLYFLSLWSSPPLTALLFLGRHERQHGRG